MKIRVQSFIIMILMLLAFAIVPKTDAVVPPPDGGYPGNNTAEGDSALFLTSGVWNTAWATKRSEMIRLAARTPRRDSRLF